MVDLAPFLYLALVIDLVAGLVVAGICFLVGSYLYRKFSAGSGSRSPPSRVRSASVQRHGRRWTLFPCPGMPEALQAGFINT